MSDPVSTLADILIALGRSPSEVNVVLDVGARDCAETIRLAAVFPTAQIFSFECNEDTIDLCRDAIHGRPRIQLIALAVSDVDGPMPFFPIDTKRTVTTWPDGNPGASSLFRASGAYPVETYVQRETVVRSTRLDTFLRQQAVAGVDLLWMDIQGAELLALRGLGTLLSSVLLIHTEVEFMEIYAGQPLEDHIKAFLTQHGFIFVGYTSRHQHAADAVFVNSRFARRAAVSRARQLLATRHLGANLQGRTFRSVARCIGRLSRQIVGRLTP
jgi:FkbM family methyltransferase